MLHVDCSDTTGAIRFSDGQCILQATDGMLLLRVEALTENALHRLQNGITHRLETFGHREHLTLCWQPSISGPTGQLDEVPAPTPAPVALTTVQRRWRLGRNLALTAAAAFAIVAHLGVLGATLATARWAADAILALIVVKLVVTAGAHVVSGGFAILRAKAFSARRKRRHTPPEREMPTTAREHSDTKAPSLVLHHAKLYDLTVWLMTLGREWAFREKLLLLARLKPGESVLDVGCGTGSLAIAAKRQVEPTGIVKGIDASPEMIARAEKKAAKARAEVAFQQAPAQALPFPEGQFDVVLTTVVLHHLSPPTRERCAQEMRRVLKPGGRVLAVDFAPRAEPKGFLRRFHRHGHVKLDDIIAILGAAGLNVTESGALDFRVRSRLRLVMISPPASDLRLERRAAEQ